MKLMRIASVALALACSLTASFSVVKPCLAITAPDGQKSVKAKLVTIESIRVNGEGDAAELIIRMSSPATYTSYKTTSPLRLVLDLSQTTLGNISTPLQLNNGNFKAITTNRFDTDAGVLTRIYIALEKDAEPLITASTVNPGELKISFPSTSTAAAKTVTESKVIEIPTPVINQSAPAPASENKAAAPDNALVTTTVRNLTGITANNGSIVLAVEGGAGEFKTFRLNKPERFVIDLPDAKSTMSSRLIPLNAAGVASARIGLYPDKVRVVLDSVDGVFPEAMALVVNEGVSIALNTKAPENFNTRLVATRAEKAVEPQDKPVEQKPAAIKVEPVIKPVEQKPVIVKSEAVVKPIEQKPVATVVTTESKLIGQKPVTAKTEPLPVPVEQKPIPSKTKTLTPVVRDEIVKPKPIYSGPAIVETVDFQVIDDISRVSVKVKGDVTVDPPVISPGYITLTIKNATIPKTLQRTLDAQSFSSPVLRITPLVVKSRSSSDIKIRIALRKVAPHEFRQEGDMLHVDLRHPAGMTFEKQQADNRNAKTAPSRKVSKTSKVAETDISSELNVSNDDVPSKQVLSGKSYKGRKVTLEFADAEVRKIFQLLSEVSGKNFVLGDEVTGNISLKLVNVPWDQALDIIMDTKSLDMREAGNVLTIKGKGKFKTQEEEAQELKKLQTKSIELRTETFSINYSDASSIMTQLLSLKSERGTVSQDTRTNKVIVKDIPQTLDDMRKLISQLDIPEKQVMIEARIVEATSTFTRTLGVNWGVHYRDGTASFLGINQMDTSFGGVASNTAPTTGVSGQSGGAMGISFGTLASNISLDLRLNAAASAGLIRIVSTPKIATLNNKQAKITQGQQVPYTSSTSDKVETKFVEAALSLEVTPHINANGTISMKIDAKNDSVGDAAGGSTAPSINKKQATTEMLLRDGETTVIGGIFVDTDNDTDSGVPYAMDIPLLGKLFRSNSKTKVKTELLIFITPRILNSL